MGAFGLLKLWLAVRPIKRFHQWREDRKAPPTDEAPVFKGKLTYTAIGAIAIGTVAKLFGVDIAGQEIDTLIQAVAVGVAVYGRWRATKV
jgi:uncharacterized protein YcfJ